MSPFKLGLVAITAVVLASAQVPRSPASSPPNRIIAQDVVITGTTALSTAELNEITSTLTSRQMGDDEKEVRGRIRDAFQQKGYIDAEVNSLKIAVLDPMARPKPSRIEAEVSEGMRFKIGEIILVGNRSLEADRLRSSLPIRPGEWFSSGKVRSGLEGLHKQYISNGYLDFTAIPSTYKTGDAKLALMFDITEGPQYRMGDLQMVGGGGLAGELQSRWKLKKGDPFDAAYIQQFVDENSASLPQGFVRNDVVTIRDCHDMTATVHIELDHRYFAKPREVDCDKANDPQ